MKLLAVIAGTVSTLLVLISNAFAFGPGFSGITANADSAETVVTNPAGMTRFKEPSFFLNPVIMYTKSETEVSLSLKGIC